MAASGRSILIDARVNALPGAHGLARSVMKLVAHMGEPDDGLALRVLSRRSSDEPRAARFAGFTRLVPGCWRYGAGGAGGAGLRAGRATRWSMGGVARE